MFCKCCGTRLDDDAVFCERCGTSVKRGAISNENLVVEISDQEDSTAGITANNNRPSITTLSGKKIILSATVFVIIVVIAIAAMSKMRVDGYDVRAQCNANNGGRFAFDDKALYFVGHYNEGDGETCVYSTSYGGGDKTIVSRDPDIYQIRIQNGKILYKSSSDDAYVVGMMDKDGSNDRVMVELPKSLDESVGEFDATSTDLYYLYGDELRKCPIAGGEESVLFDGVEAFVLAGDTLYYSTENALFSYNTKKEELTEISAIGGTSLVLSDDRNEIYLKGYNTIYKVPVNGKDPFEIITEETTFIGDFIIKGNDIYYIQTVDVGEMIDLAMSVGGDDYVDVLTAVLGMGQIKQVPLGGGITQGIDSKYGFVTDLYVSSEGIYSRWSGYAEVEPLI